MSATTTTGHHVIAGQPVADGAARFRAVDPRTGADLPQVFPEATAEQVDDACRAASEAAEPFAHDDAGRKRLLRAVADALDAAKDDLVAAADRESGLGHTRLGGEVGRTSGQLRLFADVVAAGGYRDAVIDHAAPDATPPRPDLRRWRVALGPVAVFGASNFPLAFSVAGGDTASALAAGCPVVVKGHPAHPETSQLVADIIAAAVAEVGLPAGTFSMVHGRTNEVGAALVQHPAIRAVGFTGSPRGGQALARLGAEREQPIPVFAEMGSLNPVVVTEAAAAARSDEIAQGFVGSMTMGVGQFCTKPGLLFVPDGEAGDALVAAIEAQLTDVQPDVMLTPDIQSACATRTAETAALAGVEELVRIGSDGEGNRVDAVVLGTDLDTMVAQPRLLEEHFGPTALVIRYPDPAALATGLGTVPGSLTASLFSEPVEQGELDELVLAMTSLSGRMVFDGFPTGVAVVHAMQHGGPHPATTDARFTSVGSRAIERWLRPVAYQDAPDGLLPDALRDSNPTGTWRQVDGRWAAPAE